MAPNGIWRDAHRAPAKRMIDPKSDQVRAKADRKRDRKERKAKVYMTRDTLAGAIKVMLSGATLSPAAPISEECPDCLKLRRRTA